MVRSFFGRCVGVALGAMASAPLVFAGDWTVAGGNSARNGLSDEYGPSEPTLLWRGGRPGMLGHQPVTEGHRVFMVRITQFAPETTGSPIVANDLDTGAELWATHLPYETGDWNAWVGGVANGRVFASRSGNGDTVWAKLYALDAATGAVLWATTEEITGNDCEFVLAPDGDPVIASWKHIWRIESTTGEILWTATRLGSVSGDCGPALFGNAVYVADWSGAGQVLKRFDLDTGAFLYQSPAMLGYTVQNHPLVGPDGTVYLSRTQGNVLTDFFHAFEDTGSAFVQKWAVPATSSSESELAVGPDGSVYMFAPGWVLKRLHPDTGAVLNTSIPISTTGSSPRIAIDRLGRLFVNNSCGLEQGCGRFLSFDADLTLRWSMDAPMVIGGAPALGEGGTLIIAEGGTNAVKAFRTPYTYCTAKVNLLGCTPSIQSSGGQPSASNASNFVVSCSNVVNQTSGLLFYGFGGEFAKPFQGGRLCIAGPLRRTQVTNSGGNFPAASDCSGVFTFDFNAYVVSGSAAAELREPGTALWCQWWGRDPSALPPVGTQLSDALGLVIGP